MLVLTEHSKAFDTIQHETLITKLPNLNFSNSSIKIILSYLSNRQQYVQSDDKKSSTFGFHRVASLALLYLNYMFHHYHHV